MTFHIKKQVRQIVQNILSCEKYLSTKFNCHWIITCLHESSLDHYYTQNVFWFADHTNVVVKPVFVNMTVSTSMQCTLKEIIYY